MEQRRQGAFDINTVSDLTGLSIVPAGQIYSNGAFALGYLGQAFFFYGNAGQGYNLAERDGKAADQAEYANGIMSRMLVPFVLSESTIINNNPFYRVFYINNHTIGRKIRR